MTIRLYGHLVGEGSFCQVTRGVRRALEKHDAFAGLVPVDCFSEYESYEGADAPVSVNCGNPFGVMHASLMGTHKKRWLLLAPNSERLSQAFCQKMSEKHPVLGRMFTGLLGPSTWACEVLEKHFPDFPVVLAPHGITPEIHRVRAFQRTKVRQDYEEYGEFRVLHMTSTGSGRKGTRELLQAWATLHGSTLPAKATLCIVAEPQFCTEVEMMADNLHADSVFVKPGLGLSQEQVAQLYSHAHVLVQPSRAEGFGLCTLEARACGVPSVMTNVTGHWDQCGRPEHERKWGRVLRHDVLLDVGLVMCATGENEPLDDFDNSVAPGLRHEDVAEALGTAYKLWPKLAVAAESNAEKVQSEWAWENSMAKCIHQIRTGE